jgi:hypothetical protein
LGARLETVEELIQEIVGRIGLLAEQTRQAGYRAQLAIEHWDQAHLFSQQRHARSRRKINGLQTSPSALDRRIERLRSRV